MTIKLGLFGGSGKMGKSIEQLVSQKQFEKNGLTPFLFIGNEPSTVFAVSAGQIENVEKDVLGDVDVWIDFSSELGLTKLLASTREFKTPIVSGSTGLSSRTFGLLKKNSKNRKIFWASNMSPGLWAFRQAMKCLKSISNFDFGLEEIHHNQKKDKPSGTAQTLHADLENIVGKKVPTPGSLRLGGVFGIHTIYAASSNEIISMQHTALNRNVFAEGSLLAASWLVSQKSGLYSMDELFLKK